MDLASESKREFAPLAFGALKVWPPVVLAPMAGVTNPPFRTLCRRFGAGLYVSEMITARALVEGNPKTLHLASFSPEESIRSLQLYGVDPYYIGEAVKRLVDQNHVDHIDMNFGCPVRKVTSKGGGAAIPLKPRLISGIVRAAVRNAKRIPVTIKMRIGIDEAHQTYLRAGKIAEEEGCSAVGLHARTAAQLYDGQARWEAIAQLKGHVKTIPVLGNGDIWEASDALSMMRQTGCDGVIVGRGCLGRPWLFRDLAAAFEGRTLDEPPYLGKVIEIMIHHAELLCAWQGETQAMRQFRKHASWYTKGFRHSARLRDALMRIETLADLKNIVSLADAAEPYPQQVVRVPRGKRSGTQTVSLPQGFLDNLDDDTPPESEDPGDGG